jgi:NADH-quinone oxidoreductase subunit K
MIRFPITLFAFDGALLTIGVLGVLTRRNMVIILMSIELILNAVNINLVAFSHYWTAFTGRCSRSSSSPTPPPKSAVGLGLLIALFRNKEVVNADQIELQKW